LKNNSLEQEEVRALQTLSVSVRIFLFIIKS